MAFVKRNRVVGNLDGNGLGRNAFFGKDVDGEQDMIRVRQSLDLAEPPTSTSRPCTQPPTRELPGRAGWWSGWGCGGEDSWVLSGHDCSFVPGRESWTRTPLQSGRPYRLEPSADRAGSTPCASRRSRSSVVSIGLMQSIPSSLTVPGIDTPLAIRVPAITNRSD